MELAFGADHETAGGGERAGGFAETGGDGFRGEIAAGVEVEFDGAAGAAGGEVIVNGAGFGEGFEAEAGAGDFDA